jgi:hypothetical protein
MTLAAWPFQLKGALHKECVQLYLFLFALGRRVLRARRALRARAQGQKHEGKQGHWQSETAFAHGVRSFLAFHLKAYHAAKKKQRHRVPSVANLLGEQAPFLHH